MGFYILKYLHPKKLVEYYRLQQLFDYLEGDVMIQNVTQMCEATRSEANPLRHGISILLSTFKDIEFNKPLYCFTLPGFILMAGGLYMALNLVQTSDPGGSVGFESAVGIFLLTLVGIFMSFTGILLHSITGLIKYKKINIESLQIR